MDSGKTLPAFGEISSLLSPLSSWERLSVVVIPLATILAYFLLAINGLYLGAFLALMYLSFNTYGSCCHDLVHCNFGWSRKTCSRWLSFIELLLMRSGTTYRVTHLNHHQWYPDFYKDPEGRASYYTLFRTLLEGLIFHSKLILWTLKNGSRENKNHVALEVAGIALFLGLGIATFHTYPYLLIYQILVVMGSWVIPLITSYLVHLPEGEGPIHQTRLYRGKFFRVIAMDHLYHLEHHLYPQIPHCRWKELALILNPHFQTLGLTTLRLGNKSSRDLRLN
jgi:beta-carotene hydroxylase